MRQRVALILLAVLAVAVLAWWLSASAENPGEPTQRPAVSSPLAHFPLPLEPPPIAAAIGRDGGPPSVRMRVVGPGGPVPGAAAALYLKSGPTHHGYRRPAAGGEADAEGWVVFNQLPAADDEPKVNVSAPWFAPVEVPFVAEATVTLAPLRPAVGRVLLPDRTPASGARVGSESIEDASVIADARGAFSFRLPHVSGLVAERDGLSARYVGSLDKEVELVLGKGEAAYGRVVGRDGGPLPKVDVELRLGALSRHVQTAPDGTWTAMHYVKGTGTVMFTKDGYHPFVESYWTVMNGVDVVLSRPSTILGTVVSVEGVPLAEVDVTGTGQHYGTTDVNGQFTFTEVVEEDITLEADLHGTWAAKRVAVPEGVTLTVEVMATPALINVPLEVVNVAGESNVTWLATAVPVPARGWESHAGCCDGIGLTQGRFRILVRDEFRELSGGTTVDVSPAVDARPIHIVLYGADGGLGVRMPRDPIAKVKVKVLTETGAPAIDASVTCSSGGLEPLGGGLFECAFFEHSDGAIEVAAILGTARAVTHVTIDQKEVTLTLRPTRTIRVRISGTIPADTYLEINGAGVIAEERIPSNDFELQNRPPVRTVLCIVKRDVARYGCAVAAASSNITVDIPLGAPGSVSLAVVDAKGAPVPDPMLYIDRSGMQTQSPSGKVTFVAAPGTHVLVINARGSKERAELLFTVTPEKTTDLGTVRLK